MSSEAWLIRKAKKGDTKAYGELIQLHKDYFYRNAFCYVKNVDLAGDVFQEAVTIGMLSIKDLKNPNYFRTWMTRIIYNCANEMFRFLWFTFLCLSDGAVITITSVIW